MFNLDSAAGVDLFKTGLGPDQVAIRPLAHGASGTLATDTGPALCPTPSTSGAGWSDDAQRPTLPPRHALRAAARATTCRKSVILRTSHETAPTMNMVSPKNRAGFLSLRR